MIFFSCSWGRFWDSTISAAWRVLGRWGVACCGRSWMRRVGSFGALVVRRIMRRYWWETALSKTRIRLEIWIVERWSVMRRVIMGQMLLGLLLVRLMVVRLRKRRTLWSVYWRRWMIIMGRVASSRVRICRTFWSAQWRWWMKIMGRRWWWNICWMLVINLIMELGRRWNICRIMVIRELQWWSGIWCRTSSCSFTCLEILKNKCCWKLIKKNYEVD